ncbi:ABC transporter permease [Listeria welshimeri]|nr:ABC transporter permease [Listeria welshimeri]
MKKIIFLFIIILSILLIFSHLKDPYAVNKSESLQNISWDHLFGTDYLGRDLFSRVLYGASNSLIIACLSLTIVVFLSLFLGSLAGIVGGLVDTSIMIFADSLISIPSIIVALVFVGLFSNSIIVVLIALIISWSGNYIRYIRNLVLNIRKEEFIVLAPLRGSQGSHLLFHHILPNILAELFSLFMTDLGKIILSISGLSFLGIGIHPPTPELGTILFDGKSYFFIAPWIFIFPGLAISLIVLTTQYSSYKITNYWRGVDD